MREQGTGLGLSTAFGIVRSHAGFITVESAPGQGRGVHRFSARSRSDRQQRRSEVRLVLTDVMMPGMGGVVLIRALRELAPELKIIAFTGLNRPALRADLEAAGADDVLMKPCPPEELLRALARQLAAGGRAQATGKSRSG